MTNEYKDIDIIIDNIRKLGVRKMLTNQQETLFMSLLAENEHTAPQYRTILNEYCKEAGPAAAIVFLRNLAEKTENPLSLLTATDSSYEPISPDDSALIAYVKNNYNDAAFLKFSSLFSFAKVSYCTGFEEVCEDVYNSVCDFGLLPIESANDGKLFSFYTLIEKYDLKIVAVCDIDDTHSSNKTRYALISRKSILFHNRNENAYFEFSLINSGAGVLSDILSAAVSCDAHLYRIDTISLPYDDLAFKFYHIFDARGSDILPLILYLDLKYPQFKIVGHYISIE